LTIVLASHLPGEGHFRSTEHTVIPIQCVGEHDYSRAWQQWWQTSHALIGVEHDHDPTDEQITELLDCPHPFCVFAYLLHIPSTGGPSHYAQRHGGTNYGEWIEQGEEWCDFSGIGLCKIKPEARVRRLESSSWQEVDCRISDATDCKVHVHWKRDEQGNPTGIAHHHYQ
jgi:hypothetical protein